MSNDLPCRRGISRRGFCGATGAGLIALGLTGCDPGSGRIGVGGIDNTPGGGVGSGGGETPDAGGDTTDLAKSGGPQDMAHGGSPDLSQTGGTCGSGLVSCGTASALAVGQQKRFTDNFRYDFYVCRDSAGYYALDSACTHAQCPVQVRSGKFWCNCHGATFDLNGEHPTIPAFSPLPHYAVCIDGSGNLLVDYNKTVSAQARV